jgi:hypothetical protein
MTSQWQSHVYYVQTDGSAARTYRNDVTLLDTLTPNWVHWCDPEVSIRAWLLSPRTSDPHAACALLQAAFPAQVVKYTEFIGPGRFPVLPGNDPVWDPGIPC